MYVFNSSSVFSFLLVLITVTNQEPQQSGAASTSLLYTCKNYDTVHPNGICRSFMNDANIRVDVERTQTTEEVLDLWFNVVILYLSKTLFGKKGAKIYNKTNVICAEENLPIRFRKANIQKYISYEEFAANVPSLKWSLCHFIYPVCINNNSSDVSYPCKLQDHKHALIFLLRYWQELSLACKGSALEPAHTLYKINTSSLIQPSMRSIEKCQKIPASFNPIVHVDNCFLRESALEYNGTVRRTFNGKYCIPWQSIPSFRYKPYTAYLKNKYCRNPQGHGLKPWCYTDAESRRWGYCDVSVCFETNKSVIWMTLLCVVCVVAMVALMYFFLNRQRQIDEFEKRYGRRCEREIPEGLSVSVEQIVLLT